MNDNRPILDEMFSEGIYLPNGLHVDMAIDDQPQTPEQQPPLAPKPVALSFIGTEPLRPQKVSAH